MKRMLMGIAALGAYLAVFLHAGCERRPQVFPEQIEAVAAPQDSRFTVRKVATFTDFDAYSNHRTIFLVTDTKTGKEFVGISGVGISELGRHYTDGTHDTEDER